MSVSEHSPRAAELRAAFGAFATGVTVVTVGGPDARGMTANAFTSVSLDPALLLVCVDRSATMHAALRAGELFAISVLGAGQERIARHFADPRRPDGLAQFDPVPWSPGPRTGAPLLDGALAWFECRLWRCYDGGDHSIVVGRLLAQETGPGREPLLFHAGALRPAPAGRIRRARRIRRRPTGR